jgi:hypothetical protein
MRAAVPAPSVPDEAVGREDGYHLPYPVGHVVLPDRSREEGAGMTSNEFADRLAAALGTVDLMGRALGLPRDPSFELARVSSDGLVVTVDTAGGQEEWEVKLRKLR